MKKKKINTRQLLQGKWIDKAGKKTKFLQKKMNLIIFKTINYDKNIN